MAAKRKPKTKKQVTTLTHEGAARKHIPTAEYESMLSTEAKTPLQVAYERRNRDLDPQLVWRGKDMQDWSDLVVHAPPLYIQEKVHPKVLIDDLCRHSENSEKWIVDSDGNPIHSSPSTSHSEQIEFDLFGDFNGLPSDAARTEFYQHDANWSNRMILGDSLQVMASLAERESLRGKVQCIYLDPPYGIKFNSNFQWSTTSRDVKDGNTDHITREPEQVKAFRDTWRHGIHSYLTYLRDRLTVARELLTESGSIFVQIGDENVHRVRAVMDEVFGERNVIALIPYLTTTSQTATALGSVADYLVWYAKDITNLKYRQLFQSKDPAATGGWALNYARFGNNEYRPLTREERTNPTSLPPDASLYRLDNLTSQGPTPSGTIEFSFQGRNYHPGLRNHWKTTLPGMRVLDHAHRIQASTNQVQYIRFFADFSIQPLANLWTDTTQAGFVGDKTYVVQTLAKVIERCILMATDPGDLVLDPTCGSGTTAYVAEQWGRRWITIDTSRVALALARARIMGARYPFYLLADSKEGQQKEAELQGRAHTPLSTNHDPLSTGAPQVRQGFVYERVPHITLKSIANNAEIDVIWERWQSEIAPLLEQLSAVISEQCKVNSRKSKRSPRSTNHDPLSTSPSLAEWEVPREFPEDWPKEAKALHDEFWKARIARQREIDASIAAKADHEYLYDRPYEDKKKVRVAGPFTVESISPHRTLTVDEDDELIEGVKEGGEEYGEAQSFTEMILENLKVAGVQQAHKQDKIAFTSLTGWPGEYICAQGHYIEGSEEKGISRRAGIFIGPEFGTVSRPDLVAAAREAADAGFDVLIVCAFNYDAHATDFDKLGSIPVLKARMNADLHMGGDLKTTAKGNLFVIFGEPDIEVVSEEWIVDSTKERIAPYEIFKLVSGTDSLAEINRLECDDLRSYAELSCRGEIWDYLTDAASRHLDTGEHSRGTSAPGHGGVSAVAWHCAGISGGIGNVCDSLRKAGVFDSGEWQKLVKRLRGDKQNAARTNAVARESKITIHQPLSTIHFLQVKINGVDVFHPQTGEVRSDGPEGIACWFIDTDYNEESFFVRHAYFLGANDPYKALKTTLKAEINEEAWASLHSDTSRPFDKPKSGRIAVKVINHLGDEVMKVFRV